MPKRFITYSRTEPARTILWTVAGLTGLIQTVAMVLEPSLLALPNLLLVLGICGWGVWSSTKNNVCHMSMSSFWLFFMWLYSGLTRLLVVTSDPTQMLWAPMLVVAVVMATVYLYLAHQRRVGINE